MIKALGVVLLLAGGALFALPLLDIKVEFLDPIKEHQQVVGGVAGVLGLVFVLIGFVRGKKKEEPK
jgi:hypothetical protein